MRESQKESVRRWQQLKAEELEHINRRRSLIDNGIIPRGMGEAMIKGHEATIAMFYFLIESAEAEA